MDDSLPATPSSQGDPMAFALSQQEEKNNMNPPDEFRDEIQRSFRRLLYDDRGLMKQMDELLFEEDSERHFSIRVRFTTLMDATAEFGDMADFIEQDVEQVQRWLDETVLYVQDELIADNLQGRNRVEQRALVKKENVHVRLYGLFDGPSMTRETISSIRSEDYGRLLAVHGTVIRAGAVQMVEATRIYMCSKCKHEFPVYADVEQNGLIGVPQRCPNPDVGAECKDAHFRHLEGLRVCHDFQRIKIQEQVQRLDVGTVPRSLMVVLTNDLCDGCRPGDDVVIVGTIRRLWESTLRAQRCELKTFLHASSVTVKNQKTMGTVTDEQLDEFKSFWQSNQHQALQARNKIIRNVCPQLFGLHMPKLSVLLTLIGGVRREGDAQHAAVSTRGESHLLIIGDPGTGKSQLLKYAAQLAVRSVMTTGHGTTSSGLTVSAVKEKGGEWSLEAGALVLADGGLCCIDEFGCIKEADRATIHEAMEQQTLSVAKAGLVCTLNTRCTVFGVMNPKGAYDPECDLSENTGIASPLLSRFDIILLMLDDNKNQQWNKRVTDHILNMHDPHVAQDPADDLTSSTDAALSETEDAAMRLSRRVWSLEDMQSYLTIVRRLRPELSARAKEIITAYYLRQRRNQNGHASRTTVRMLESLVRLSQAHARLMCRNVVLPQDAVQAIIVAETSDGCDRVLESHGDNAMQLAFDEQPDEAYVKVERRILHGLGLQPVSKEDSEHKLTDVDAVFLWLQDELHGRHGRQGDPDTSSRDDSSWQRGSPTARKRKNYDGRDDEVFSSVPIARAALANRRDVNGSSPLHAVPSSSQLSLADDRPVRDKHRFDTDSSSPVMNYFDSSIMSGNHARPRRNLQTSSQSQGDVAPLPPSHPNANDGPGSFSDLDLDDLDLDL